LRGAILTTWPFKVANSGHRRRTVQEASAGRKDCGLQPANPEQPLAPKDGTLGRSVPANDFPASGSKSCIHQPKDKAQWNASSIRYSSLPCRSAACSDPPKSKDAKVTLVYQQELPNVPGKSIKGVLVEYGPGGYSAGHTHAKSAFIYATVLEGEIKSKVNDRGDDL
jgi:hypothetical protein